MGLFSRAGASSANSSSKAESGDNALRIAGWLASFIFISSHAYALQVGASGAVQSGGSEGTVVQQSATAITRGADNNPPERFKVYDATLFSGKPDMPAIGFNAVEVIYEWPYYRGSRARGMPPESRIDEVARYCQSRIQSGAIERCPIDIENRWYWPGDNEASASEQIRGMRMFQALINQSRRVAPNVKWGAYAMGAALHRAWMVQFGENSAYYRQWQAMNDQIIPFTRLLDYLSPTAYPVHPSQQYWLNDITSLVRESHRMARAAGKPNMPIYPFITWLGHPNGDPSIANRYIGDAYWRFMLETLWAAYERGDVQGFYVWGGYDGDAGRPLPFNPNDRWYVVLREFMQAHGLTGNQHGGGV